MKKLISFLLAVVMVFALCACGGSTNNDANAEASAAGDTADDVAEAPEAAGDSYIGKTLTVALDSEPTSLLCQAGTPTKSEQTVTSTMYDYLYNYGEDGTLQPAVATGYEWVDDLTMRVFIREGMIAPDGTELTAQDVIFSWQLGTEGTNASMYSGNFDIDNWTCEDNYTLLIKFTAPYPTFPDIFCTDAYTIVDQSSYEAVGGMDAASLNPSCNTGRYNLVEWKSGQYILLEYNENYWDESYVPEYQYIKYIFISDAAARCLAVQSGDADMAEQVALSNILAYEGVDGLAVMTAPTNSSVPLFINCQSEPFQNEEVRKALEYLIDWEALNESFTNGLAPLIETSVSSGSIYYYDYYDRTYDPDLGKQMIIDAGYPDGFSCYLFAEPTDGYSDMCELIQYYLSYANIDVEIDYASPTNFFDTVQNYRYDLLFSGASGNLNFMCAYYDNRPDAALLCGGSNYTSQELYDILDVITSTFDSEERLEYFKQLQEFIIEHRLTYGVCSLVQYTLYNGNAIQEIPYDQSGNNLICFVKPVG